jgi:DNA replication and repair protein RecF
MAKAFLASLSLTDFRSYHSATVTLDGGPVVLFGANGAGKTNLLEAVSYLSPGRGLRSAAATEVGRRAPAERTHRSWSVSALISDRAFDGDPNGQIRIGTGIEPGGGRRLVRIDGEPAAPARLAEHLRLVWLTPQQDRLFLEGGTDRRRFLDRLTFADRPVHAVHAAAYERAMRERLRLLTAGPADPAWLDALEIQAGEAGAGLAQGRAETVKALQAEIDRRSDRPFPLARLSLTGEWGAGADPIAIAQALRRSRERDAAAGRSLAGPGRTDLVVIHAEKERPAAECSTGEQKALILNLILAQASRLARPKAARAESAPTPILLLDEVAAHLDAQRRASLAQEIAALGLQVFLTGTDRSLFDSFDAAEVIRVEASPDTGGVLTPIARSGMDRTE